MLGSYYNSFSGTFDGNDKAISDLTINNPYGSYTGFTGNNRGAIKNFTLNNYNLTASNYAGFAGFNNGTLTGIALNNIDINAKDYAAGLVGYNENGHILDSSVKGSVTGSTNVGFAAGKYYSDGGYRVTSIIVEGNVTGINNVGGLVGYVYNRSGGWLSGINKGGAITSTGANVGRMIGVRESYYYGDINASGLALSSITINGSTVSSAYNTSNHGANFNSLADLNNINLVELALDTYIGGDTDGNGLYWDYDATGNVIRKKVADYPLTFSLAGAGTAADPYLVNTYEDLRQATLKLGSVYKLNTDIDMTSKKHYMMGSYYNSFSGTFDGNDKTINNLVINNPYGSYTGFIGNNRGTIKNLTLNNYSLTASNYAGFAGYNNGTLTGIALNSIDINAKDYAAGLAGSNENGHILDSSVKGNVTGYTNVGMAAGHYYADGGYRVTSIIVEGNVTGINNVGGLVGYVYNRNGGWLSGINKGGTITSTGSSVGRLIGVRGSYYYGDINASGLALSSITVNGSTVSSAYNTSNHGADFNSLADLNNINLVELALDTYIGGDTDGNGLYWDYDAAGNVVRKKVIDYPLTFSLVGAGTAADPYLINTYDDLRQATLKLGSVYKLNANIDMASKKHYMLGSYYNAFTGTFDGNNNTISNLTLNNSYGSYTGFAGNNRGTISNIVINNYSIIASNYAGFVGYNNGTIKGIALNNINTNAKDFAAGLAGSNENGHIMDCTVTGNVSGNTHVGLVAGHYYADGGYKVTNIVVEGDVTGINNVGGLVGYVYNRNGGTLSGIVKGGTIIATGNNIGRVVGVRGSYYYGDINLKASALSSITLNGSVVTSTSISSNHGLDITSSELSNDITYTNVGFNFTDEALEYIWYLDGGVAKFRAGSL
jgi:ribosomal protein S17E